MRKILIVLLCLLSYSGFAQNKNFIVDTTFKPFFDIRAQPYPYISDIYESKSRKLYITGNFEIPEPSNNQIHENFISIKTNGLRNSQFTGTDGGGGGKKFFFPNFLDLLPFKKL